MNASTCHGFITDMPRDEILALRNQGLSNQEIAEKLKISKSTVFRMIGAQPLVITQRVQRDAYWNRNGGVTTGPIPLDVVTTTRPPEAKTFRERLEELDRQKGITRDAEPAAEPAKTAAPAVKRLVPISRVLKGEAHTYTVEGDAVTVASESEIITIRLDKLADFIAELQEVLAS